jgi:hypothetical protein
MTHFLASFVKAAFLRTWQTLRSRMLAGRPCHVTGRRITPETYFGITSDHVSHYERGIYTNLYPRLPSTRVLAVLGEGCQGTS